MDIRSLSMGMFENLIVPQDVCLFQIVEVVLFETISEATLLLPLSIFRVCKDSSTKQDLYSVLNLPAASVKQYKVPDKQLGVITWI